MRTVFEDIGSYFGGCWLLRGDGRFGKGLIKNAKNICNKKTKKILVNITNLW